MQGRRMTFNEQGESELLHRFRRRAYPIAGRIITAGEAIFLARHHGLPTRLLDWTANALFALYFACSEHQDDDARIWAMHRRPRIHELDSFSLAKLESEAKLFKECVPFYETETAVIEEEESEENIQPAIKLVHPFYNSPRLVAQDGAFTIHSYPSRSIKEQVEYELPRQEFGHRSHAAIYRASQIQGRRHKTTKRAGNNSPNTVSGFRWNCA